MKKQLPPLTSDKEAEKFVAWSDLTEYDLSGTRMVRFEFQPKSERGQHALAASAAGRREGIGRQGGRSVSALRPAGARNGGAAA